VGLTRAARVKNLRGSFGVKRPDRIRGRNILLVDDVSTTGSTIAEASKTIMRAGAAQVDVLVLAVRMEVSTRMEKDTTLTPPEHLISDKSLPAEQKQ
jgi:orotate phosphoribosyltransferase